MANSTKVASKRDKTTTMAEMPGKTTGPRIISRMYSLTPRPPGAKRANKPIEPAKALAEKHNGNQARGTA